MPFPTLNTLMDHKTKPMKSEMIIIDQSNLAKSAAWAWYEHGSGSDGRSIHEVDLWRSKMEPRPTRYKLELLRNVQLDSTTKNSLLDNYEIERISKQLDNYIEGSHAKYHDKGFLKKKMPRGGFWSRHVQLCRSSRNDVVEISSRFECRPEKRGVAVAGVGSCQPRPWAIRA